MVDREQILQIIRREGPVIPVQIGKAIDTNIIFASAMLGELADKKQVKISNVKVGGTPLYYLPEQKARLQEYAKHLKHKEKQVYELLKQKKLLRDKEQIPVVRVGLRNIKDFAVALEVNVNGGREIFWKWYLLSNDEATQMIKQKLNIQPKKEVEPAKQEIEEKVKEEKKESVVEAVKQAGESRESGIERPVEQRARRQEPKHAAQIKPDVQKKLSKPKEIKDDFTDSIKRYFQKNSINIIENKVLRKNAEAEFIVEIPSPVGNIMYYCKAKNKKRVNDGDLSSAFVAGQIKKLPVLFLTTGEPSKKAKELMNTELRNIKFKQI